MKHLYTSRRAKTLAVVLAMIIGVGAFWSAMFTLMNWDDLWMDGGFYESSAAAQAASEYRRAAADLARLELLEDWQGSLDYLERQNRAELQKDLLQENTNFRVQIHTQAGEKLFNNLEGQSLAEQVHAVNTYSEELSWRSEAGRGDDSYWDSAQELQLIQINSPLGTLVFSPAEADQAAAYGWSYMGGEWSYSSELDERYHTEVVVIEYGVTKSITVSDSFSQALNEYIQFKDLIPVVALLTLFLSSAELFLLVFLCTAAGRRRDMGAYVLNWQDRIPAEIYAALCCIIVTFVIGGSDQAAYSFNRLGPTVENITGIAFFSLVMAGGVVALLLTLATRFKTHTLLRNTLCWRCCAGLGHWMRRIYRNWSMVWRFGLLFCFYLVGTLISTMTLILIPIYQGAVLYLILRWVKQWRAIRTGAGRIVGGDPDFKIDTAHMYNDLREHAEQLNDLGSAIGNAVDERMKSERFKTELITNVSHDLKTPLTSIINYVDLLKKVELENPKALEYISVLDRKSQRLKKLTEDLVEASKASTGALTVEKERLGLVQLLQQALGEYEEKFQQKGLQLVPTLPQRELYVEADGRHLWRIIDNLLSNCNKYAMEGTRIYLDLTRWDGAVILAIKNISRQALNIPADQLMERFVRGEESRSTEGSGLGLSIARSLTELQGGEFRLSVDGDLFKAMVTFPEAPVSIPPQPVLPPQQSGKPDEVA